MTTAAQRLSGSAAWKPLPRQSLACKDAFGLGIQRFPLCCLATASDEALDVELLTRLLHRLHPLLQRARCVSFFGPSGRFLAHNPASLALHQLVLGHATACLLFATGEHGCTGPLSLCDLAHLHGFLGLHGLHGWRHISRPQRNVAKKAWAQGA